MKGFTTEDTEDTEYTNEITHKIIGAAMRVHTALGPGLLESAYEACVAYELEQQGLRFERQKPLPLVYHQVKLDCGYRLDLLVEDRVVVEIKSVETLAPIHTAQLLSYLRLAGCRIGLLINFNVLSLKNGIRRVVNDTPKNSVSSVSSVVK
jgi:GxxExxY protein